MRSLIQSTPAYELSIDITTSAHGHSLKLISLVPSARNPEDHVKFQGLFSSTELRSLRDALNDALSENPVTIPESESTDMPGTAVDALMNIMALQAVKSPELAAKQARLLAIVRANSKPSM